MLNCEQARKNLPDDCGDGMKRGFPFSVKRKQSNQMQRHSGVAKRHASRRAPRGIFFLCLALDY
jgi:hypothetical protein